MCENYDQEETHFTSFPSTSEEGNDICREEEAPSPHRMSLRATAALSSSRLSRFDVM